MVNKINHQLFYIIMCFVYFCLSFLSMLYKLIIDYYHDKEDVKKKIIRSKEKKKTINIV